MALNKGYLTAKTDKASDEYFTPRWAVDPIIKHIPSNVKTVWCPFDYEDSEYVKALKEAGYKVLYSHIDNGENFFEYEPSETYDCIISNPPFSIKDDILKRLFELNKPYAVLFPIPTLQGQKRFPYLKDCQALIFDKRISFYKDREHTLCNGSVSFGSFYLCKEFLNKDLIFEEIEKE